MVTVHELDWPTTKEAQVQLNLSGPYVRRLITQGMLSARRIASGGYLIDPMSIAEYKKARQTLDRDTTGRVIDGRRRRQAA
jgi:excisionase family DNA binding protein